MKKTGLLLCGLMLMALTMQAQVWLEAGGKMMYGITGLYNDNIINDANHSFRLNTAISAGGVIGLNIGDHHGLNIEGIVTKHQQDMTFQDDFTTTPTRNEIQWNTFDIYVLYRYYTGSGPFLEAGPKFSNVREIEQEFGTERYANLSSFYHKNYLSGVFGFGGFLAGSPAMTLKMGLRAEYALNDFVNDNGDIFDFPTPYTNYDVLAETRPFRATIYLELNFGVGGFAQTQCGRRAFILGSRYK